MTIVVTDVVGVVVAGGGLVGVVDVECRHQHLCCRCRCSHRHRWWDLDAPLAVAGSCAACLGGVTTGIAGSDLGLAWWQVLCVVTAWRRGCVGAGVCGTFVRWRRRGGGGGGGGGGRLACGKGRRATVNMLESACVSKRGQRVVKGKGGEEEQPKRWGRDSGNVLRVPAFGPDFRDNHTKREEKQGQPSTEYIQHRVKDYIQKIPVANAKVKGEQNTDKGRVAEAIEIRK
ncbi:hypothetical protein EDB85DRAFT_1887960 [Lactarius pseudohatsudake]|nr:hypothetical protein EDB85DRAFT_1887960 [Lactarius pseudohatsudake]